MYNMYKKRSIYRKIHDKYKHFYRIAKSSPRVFLYKHLQIGRYL